MGKLCSHPRKYARHLANCLIISLHEEEMTAWVANGYILEHVSSGISVSSKTGDVWIDDDIIWMPFFQKWKLRRADRQRAIQMTTNHFFKS